MMINESKKREPSPNAHLGPSGMARRIGESYREAFEKGPTTPHDDAKTTHRQDGPSEAQRKIRAAKASASSPRARKSPPITLAKSAAAIVEETKKGRGRPAAGGRKKPWEEAGLSKREYYRQKPEAKA